MKSLSNKELVDIIEEGYDNGIKTTCSQIRIFDAVDMLLLSNLNLNRASTEYILSNLKYHEFYSDETNRVINSESICIASRKAKEKPTFNEKIVIEIMERNVLPEKEVVYNTLFNRALKYKIVKPHQPEREVRNLIADYRVDKNMKYLIYAINNGILLEDGTTRGIDGLDVLLITELGGRALADRLDILTADERRTLRQHFKAKAVFPGIEQYSDVRDAKLSINNERIEGPVISNAIDFLERNEIPVDRTHFELASFLELRGNLSSKEEEIKNLKKIKIR